MVFRLQRGIQRYVLVVVMLAFVLPALAIAQSAATGAISGVARDTTGAVLPGVTVEASSPSLIEKVRVAITDSQGNYKILELRPGTYAVTFTLPGFATFRREGIELATGFNATVNADMKVGALEETVTVTGASPVVDIQNVRTQSVFARERLDELPVARNLSGVAALTLGAMVGTSANQFDVGGTKGEQPVGISIHGSLQTDSRMKIDGLSFQNNSGDGGGQNHVYRGNVIAFQETTVETGGMSAESDTGGVQMNYVPKEGGNKFALYAVAQYTNGDFQSNNLSDAHRARGLTTGSTLSYVYDYGLGVGGPIVRDRLWFYTAHRSWATADFRPGSFFNKTQAQFIGAANSGVVLYTPDSARATVADNSLRDHDARLTWQVGEKHKLSLSQALQWKYNNFQGASATVAPESVSLLHFTPISLTHATWSHPASNRLLMEGGVAYMLNPKDTLPADGVTAETIQVTDSLLGLRYGAFASMGSTAYSANGQAGDQANGRVAVSYVTGSHAFKSGLTFYRGWDKQDRFVNQSLSYTFQGGVPLSITQWASPVIAQNNVTGIALFTQDQWTVRRLTANLGLRFDYFNGTAVAADLPESRFLPARHFDSVEHVPQWTDLSPRMGVAYDLFGDGRTAIKGSLGRFVQSMGVGLTELVNPQQALTLSANRNWRDDGDFVPNCELSNPLANGECGALNNNNFGRSVVTTQYSEEYTRGFANRPYNWQLAATLQQELRSGVALNVGYFRTWYGNFTVTDNLAVSPSDYDEYCVTAPSDTRLPGGGGQQLCGLYDLSPSKFGQVMNVVVPASNFGEMTTTFNGVDIGVNARFPGRSFLSGGVSVGRLVTDECVVVDSPQDAREGFCKVVPPWAAAAQFKLNGMYPLPLWGIELSATYQNVAGAAWSADNTYRNAAIAPSLGRNLASGPNGSVSVSVLAPQAQYENRISNLDVRLTKGVRLNGARLRGTFDVFNIFNSGTVLAVTGTYGPNWLRPTNIQGGRLLKFGAVLEF